jgi:FlaA1/EpsC-like NDP-sugar epimerase
MQEKSAQSLILVLTDIIAVYASLVAAYYTRVLMGQFLPLIPLTFDLSFYLAKWWFILLVPAAMGYYGGYSIIIDVWDDMLIVIKGLFISFLITWVILSLQKEAEMVSRIVITLSFVYMVFAIPLARLLVKFFVYKVLNLRRESIMLAGPGERERELVQMLNKEWYSGYRNAGSIIPSKGDSTSVLCPSGTPTKAR